jgi:hypothetical protein
MHVAGASPTALDLLPGKSNYFFGNNPQNWHTDVPNYAQVQYPDIYPGIDLLYQGTQAGQVTFTFVVNPGASPDTIRLDYDGAQALAVDGGGNLQLMVAGGTQVQQTAPVLYQLANGVRQTVSGGYSMLGPNEVGVHAGSYDSAKPLYIDPTYSYSFLLGGSTDDYGYGVAVDTAGSAFVVGETTSLDFPTLNPFKSTFVAPDSSFVTKVTPQGYKLVYSTYLGSDYSDSDDRAYGVAVDRAGYAYVTGMTSGDYFPTTPGAVQSTYGGMTADGYVTKLSTGGDSLMYSTYLGGSDYDESRAIAIDPSSDAYVAGTTQSTDFPVQNPLEATLLGPSDAFVAELNPTGTGLVYSTYLGGSSYRGPDFEADGDRAEGIAVDAAGRAYVVGDTHSADFPLQDPFQPAYGGGFDDHRRRVPHGQQRRRRRLRGQGAPRRLEAGILHLPGRKRQRDGQRHRGGHVGLRLGDGDDRLHGLPDHARGGPVQLRRRRHRRRRLRQRAGRHGGQPALLHLSWGEQHRLRQRHRPRRRGRGRRDRDHLVL